MPWPLYLHGAAGTGKTSAALALLDMVGPKGANLAAPRIVLDWAAGFLEAKNLARLKIGSDRGRFQWSSGGEVSWDGLKNNLCDVTRMPLFVIDDIGTAREASDFSRETLLEVLDCRCDDPVRPLVVTGNLAPGQLATAYDDRVASRILCGTVYHLGGADRRAGTEE
jgi:hypothetical protein